MGQRLVRAKAKIKQAGIPFRVPEKEELASRLETVLDAIYAAFGEGWSDAPGTDSVRRDLAEEAIFLGRLVAHLLPEEPEALGLVALMLHAEARRFARRDQQGGFVPLAEQDIRLWDAQMIREAEEALLRASEFGMIGRYQLEGALQSAHATRQRTCTNNWAEVVQLYDALLALSGSPVVAINRALAVSELEGPDSGLAALNAVAEDGRLVQYQPYWAARAELLARTGARMAARHAYDMAIGLERDLSVRLFLQKRQAGLDAG
jgi:RNA polymerase sigma-70 factor (ECF subfamily)